MLEVKSSVITRAELYTRGLKTLRAAFPGMKYIPLTTQTSPLNLIENLFLRIKFVTLDEKEYESKDDWCLFRRGSSLEEYAYISSLFELFNLEQEIELEDLEGKEVNIIVDDAEYPKRDVVLALGISNKYVLPNWIGEKVENGTRYYSEEEALSLLSEFI